MVLARRTRVISPPATTARASTRSSSLRRQAVRRCSSPRRVTTSAGVEAGPAGVRRPDRADRAGPVVAAREPGTGDPGTGTPPGSGTTTPPTCDHAARDATQVTIVFASSRSSATILSSPTSCPSRTSSATCSRPSPYPPSKYCKYKGEATYRTAAGAAKTRRPSGRSSRQARSSSRSARRSRAARADAGREKAGQAGKRFKVKVTIERRSAGRPPARRPRRSRLSSRARSPTPSADHGSDASDKLAVRRGVRRVGDLRTHGERRGPARLRLRRQHLPIDPDDQSSVVNLTQTGVATEKLPRWSPDGSRIAFAANYGLGGKDDIFVTAPGRTDADNVSQTAGREEGYKGHPAWSPDGSQLLYDARVVGTTNDQAVSDQPKDRRHGRSTALRHQRRDRGVVAGREEGRGPGRRRRGPGRAR